MPAGVSAAVNVGGAIAGGVTGMNTAAANGQLAQQAGQQSNQLASQIYNNNSQNFTPYINQGSSATTALGGLLGLNGDTASQQQFQNYLNSTNYQFQLGQGENAIKTQNAPAYLSGATAKALNNYAQGQAGSALSGYESLLQNQGQQGLSASSSLGSLGSQYANQYSNNLMSSVGAQIGANNQGQTSLNNMIGGLGQGLSSFSTSPLGKSLGTSFTNAFSPATNTSAAGVYTDANDPSFNY
jgi:hypothetical protein